MPPPEDNPSPQWLRMQLTAVLRDPKNRREAAGSPELRAPRRILGELVVCKIRAPETLVELWKIMVDDMNDYD